jgi:hypothetical protein
MMIVDMGRRTGRRGLGRIVATTLALGIVFVGARIALAHVHGDTQGISLEAGESGTVSMRLQANKGTNTLAVASPPNTCTVGPPGGEDYNTPDPVHALNGEITYDAALLENFSVEAGPGAEGFTVLGHEPSPGTFRFLAFDPAEDTPLLLDSTVLRFSFDAVAGVTGSKTTYVDFSVCAAARVVEGPPEQCVSIAIGGPSRDPKPESVQFHSFSVVINGDAQAREWDEYK